MSVGIRDARTLLPDRQPARKPGAARREAAHRARPFSGGAYGGAASGVERPGTPQRNRGDRHQSGARHPAGRDAADREFEFLPKRAGRENSLGFRRDADVSDRDGLRDGWKDARRERPDSALPPERRDQPSHPLQLRVDERGRALGQNGTADPPRLRRRAAQT